MTARADSVVEEHQEVVDRGGFKMPSVTVVTLGGETGNKLLQGGKGGEFT